LFDAKEGRKLTEDFHFNINSDDAKEMLKTVQNESNGVTDNNSTESSYPPEWSNIPKGYLTKVRQVCSSCQLF
jgi:hypothetical protein